MSIQNRYSFIGVLILITAILAGCTATPTAAPVQPSAPPSSTAAYPPPGAVTPQASATSVPAAAQTAYPGPGAASTPPSPTEVSPTASGRVVGLADNNSTVTLHIGDRFVLELGEGYNWTVDVANQSIASRVINITPLRGSQGVYEAHDTGSTTLTASGDPLCRSAKPACSLPSLLFQVNIVVQ